MAKTIQQKIVEYLKPVAETRSVVDVRIGLGYTSVRLDNGNVGLAWTARNPSGSCTHEAKAGTLAGSPARKLLEMLSNPQGSLSGTLGMATANALAVGIAPPETSTISVLELVDVQADDHVVMVGYFGPLVPRIKQTGCRFGFLERDNDMPGALSPEEGDAALAACSVAIITATSIINGTIDELLSKLGKPRAVVILGPSAFMRPEVFAETPVTHIGGSRVRDASAVEKIVSEGGGTMVLKRFLDFETIVMKQ